MQRLRARKQYEVSAPIEVIEVRRVDNLSNVRAFVSLRIGGVTVHGAKIVQQPGQRPWLAMPDQKWTSADGKQRYSALVELSPSLKARVSDAILTGWAELAP